MNSSSLVLGYSLPDAQVIDYLIPNHYLLHGKTAYHTMCTTDELLLLLIFFVLHVDFVVVENFVAALELFLASSASILMGHQSPEPSLHNVLATSVLFARVVLSMGGW